MNQTHANAEIVRSTAALRMRCSMDRKPIPTYGVFARDPDNFFDGPSGSGGGPTRHGHQAMFPLAMAQRGTTPTELRGIVTPGWHGVLTPIARYRVDCSQSRVSGARHVARTGSRLVFP